MYVPSRGGTRGGAADFSWEAVKNDKSREHYLGHSIMAPTGRWQKGKDVNWYNKSSDATPADQEAAHQRRLEEIAAVKQQEQDAMASVLGFQPISNPLHKPNGSSTGANRTTSGPMRKWGEAGESEKDEELKQLEAGMSKDDRKAAKALAKIEAKQQRQEGRHRPRGERHSHHGHFERRHRDHRSEDRRDEHRRHHSHRSSRGRPHHEHRREHRETDQSRRSRSRSHSPSSTRGDLESSRPSRSQSPSSGAHRSSSGRDKDSREGRHRYSDRPRERDSRFEVRDDRTGRDNPKSLPAASRF